MREAGGRCRVRPPESDPPRSSSDVAIHEFVTYLHAVVPAKAGTERLSSNATGSPLSYQNERGRPESSESCHPIRYLLLRDLEHVGGIRSRPDLQAFHVAAERRHLGLLVEHHEGAVLPEVGLHFLVHRLALGRVALEDRGVGLLRQLGDDPRIAPRERLRLRVVGVVGVAREGVGVGVRVPIIGAPLADVDVVGARPVLRQRLLAVAGQDFDVDPGALGRLLERFRNALHRLHGAHVDR